MEIMKSFRIRREEYKKYPFGYYHLCLDGWRDGNLFNTVQEFVFGMATIALVVLKFKLTIYVFELMSNHIHIILSASGDVCVKVFDFILRRIRGRLKADGFPEPPEGYGFVLVPIPDREAMLKQVVYTVRNPYERGYSAPGGYLWGSDYLIFNPAGQSIRGMRAESMSVREMRETLGARDILPPDWEVHPELGVLPRNYVNYKKVEGLFGSVKEYATRIVKDYESFSYAAKSLGEELILSDEEVKGLIETEVARMFAGRSPWELTVEEKYRVIALMNHRYGIQDEQLAKEMRLSVRVVRQVVTSKDYKRLR